MPAQKLKRFLDEHEIRYVSIQHSAAYTAQETAASAHIPGRELAKTVIVNLDGKMAMAVLPATAMLNLDAIKRVAQVRGARLATEGEFKNMFPDCEVGAMPPLGNLYEMPVFVDEHLTEDDQIAFNAGSHRELIQMSYKDFHRLVQPTVARLVYRAAAPA